MARVRSVDEYLEHAPRWRDELAALRKILGSSGLTEEIKWGAPCYTLHGKNVVGMAAFKSYFGLWFHQGALLTDERGVLVNAQEGRTKAQRQWRMTSAGDIRPSLVRSYVKKAIALAREGREIKPDRAKRLVVPPELAAALRRNRTAARAFEKLTPGRRREYAEHVAEAKREETKRRRVEKILPMIAAGKGLNDRYR